MDRHEEALAELDLDSRAEETDLFSSLGRGPGICAMAGKARSDWSEVKFLVGEDVIKDISRIPTHCWKRVADRGHLECWKAPWNGASFALPKECPYPYRIAFVVKGSGNVMPLQQCVQVKYEEQHKVSSESWPFKLDKYSSGSQVARAGKDPG